MRPELTLSASLVLYQNDPHIVHRAVTSLLSTPLNIKLAIADPIHLCQNYHPFFQILKLIITLTAAKILVLAGNTISP